MKYYIIAGEASGDLHASHLMRALQERDPEADFRFFGGEKMQAVGGTMVRNYRELAYMGFIPVLLHLPTILRNMRQCKDDIRQWQPDTVILVDYPGFNLKIAKFVHEQLQTPVYYYISPKIWAWKEYRIKNIKRDVDELFSILPFEVAFYEGKHHYPINYVGNPTADEVRSFREGYNESPEAFRQRHGLSDKPIIALLAGSRQQEIRDNLPTMIEAAKVFTDYQLVLAGAPSIDDDYYRKFITEQPVTLVHNDTYALLANATMALVTSGTATLETALFNVPQVVCYETNFHWIFKMLRRLLLKVKYVSLVNLIADREVVTELVADTFKMENIRHELEKILPGQPERDTMLKGYAEARQALGDKIAPEEAASIMVGLLAKRV